MGQATITVGGYFGKDKEITREEFIRIWCQHVLELKRLDYDQEWITEVEAIHSKVEAKANNEFDEMFFKEHGVYESDYRMGDDDE